MNNEDASETSQGSNKNTIAASSVPSKSETTIAASISSVTRDTGMMAIHQTHSASAHKFSGSPNTIDSTQATRNSCPGTRTDPEFHHQGGSQRSTVHHVSNQIRTFRAMPSVSAAEQLSATTHQSRETTSEQYADTSTIQSSTTENNRRDQQEQMCLGTSNVQPSETMTGGSSVGGSTSSRTGGRSDFDDQSQSSSKASSSSKRKRPIKMKAGQTLGRWTPEEHEAFLQGLKVFGREWKKVAERIPTRTSAQIRSHAQKYFAKIQREETIMMQDAAVAATQLASQPFNNTIPEAVAPPPQVPPTVQRNVERILANPTGLQREVEDTMRELRERYHQLQVRLAETSRRRHGAPPLRGRVVENNDPDRRKRPLEEVMHHNDDLSSVSSTISGYTRELGDEELIALSVLGGALPRSASNQDLRRAASNDDKSQLSARSENSSSTSTIASHRQNSQAGESDEDKNKKRKVTDEEPSNDSNVDDESTNTRDDMVL